MIAKPNGLLLILLIILLTHSISYFLQKNVSDFCFVRLSSFFAHNLFTNLQYDKTIKNNNLFLIDFFHTFLSFKKPAFIGWLFYFIWNFFCISFLPHNSTSFRWARFLALFVKLLFVTTMALSAL
mgnify:CR=1 FL=1